MFCLIFVKGLNVALYYNNPDPNEYYSMVPISARTEDGMGSLIALIIEKCQTNLAKRIIYTNKLKATVMEVSSYLKMREKLFFFIKFQIGKNK